ncbi:Uncharacterised protein [Mycolicibacterium vanbaalenii]|uniref:Uncharacterized protein n=1 Tax=Mycolicibacterium vanbaalenii TaxID=110539 RepID=A0A5S9R723_MYCVN|nr:hypothetical protein [Mycolicibacterium vanbaalenii]CAA0129298.1 Uncharacterised protein [Mycolicibacterium vanbaalenii]
MNYRTAMAKAATEGQDEAVTLASMALALKGIMDQPGGAEHVAVSLVVAVSRLARR